MEQVVYATVSDPRSLAPDQVRRRMEEQLQANASRPLFTGTAVSHTASTDRATSRIKLRRIAWKTRDPSSRVYFSLEHGRRSCTFSFWKQVYAANWGAQGRAGGESTTFPSLSVDQTNLALQGYEEVTVPPAKVVPPRATEKLIRVADLDPLARGSFPVSR